MSREPQIDDGEHMKPGNLCLWSFAKTTHFTIEPLQEGWGVCRQCGEVLNTRHGFLPEHLIPSARAS